MRIKFTNPDPRDFPTLGLLEVAAGHTVNIPAAIAADLIAQGVAVEAKPKPVPTSTEEK